MDEAMIDKPAMRSLLKSLEEVAQRTMQQDSAFCEALQALKWEIDRDARVQSALRSLQAAGLCVFSSFVPRIKVGIRTEEGVLRLPNPPEMESAPVDHADKLAQELRQAATAVIRESRYSRELASIVNEAVAANKTFENLASKIETAGHEVLVSLDLSAYSQVQEKATPRLVNRQPSADPTNLSLSAFDRGFLKMMKVSV
jgi:hypothetical protein